MYILGISCHYHDSAAALVSDGKLIAASLEERFSAVKHDSSFPRQAVINCLKNAGIISKDLDFVVFYEKPFLKFERVYQSILNYSPRTFGLFKDATFNTFGSKLFIRSEISRSLGITEDKILFIPHHLSHASSSFLCSPFNESAIITIDGVGEWSTASIGIGNKNEIRILKEMRFPNSLGLLYSLFTSFLGFEVNEGEYKVMGLSGYGEPIYKSKIQKIIKIYSDGSIEPDLAYFSYHYHNRRSYSEKFIEFFGKPRKPKSPFDFQDKKDRYYADIAASIQSVTEDIVLKIAEYAQKITKQKKLCLSGGVALNGIANYKIARSGLFEDIFIQPAAGDAGGALGAALYIDYFFGKHKRFVMNNVYYGCRYSNMEIKKIIGKLCHCGEQKSRRRSHRHQAGFSLRRDNPPKTVKDLVLLDHGIASPHFRSVRNDTELCNFIASKITHGKIIGWFQGRCEWGPRALGNRSILADPRNPEMKKLVNEKIKFREPFRPFAPSVLAEYSNEYFDLDQMSLRSADRRRSNPPNFMLYVVPVKKEKQKLIPSVTHIDGTSRPQIINFNTNPLFYNLIKAFYKITGIPMLLNTSFNLSTEPMVNSPQDALKTFKESGLDILVMGNYIMEKDENSEIV